MSEPSDIDPERMDEGIESQFYQLLIVGLNGKNYCRPSVGPPESFFQHLPQAPSRVLLAWVP